MGVIMRNLKIRKITSDPRGLRGIAEINVGGIILYDIKIVESKDGKLSIKMPERKFKDTYKKFFKPANPEVFRKLEEYIIYEYKNMRDKGFIGLISAIAVA